MADFLLKRGMNLHTVSYNLDEGLVCEENLKIISDAGFDHIRIPVAGRFLEERGEEYWAKISDICNMALKLNLIPMIDMHGYPNIYEDPMAAKEGYLELWRKLSEYWADLDERVVFELLNEPHNNYTFKILNEIQNEAIKIVRKTNPTRWIAVASAHFNVIENLHFLDLPDDDRIFVTIHDYTPMSFTHQGAEWISGYADKNIEWGSKEEMDYLIARYDVAATWAKLHNKQLHLGEFGVLHTASMDKRAKWTSFITKLCEERNIAWSYWEFSKGFGAYDLKSQSWHPEILNSLIK